MTSKIIVNSVLNGYKPNFPVEGKNQPSQPFRDNFGIIKRSIDILAEEVGFLQGKQITIAGDATGVSPILGSTATQPGPLNLTLADTGVVAGEYTTANKTLTLTVDSKGRLTVVSAVDIPTRPGIDATVVPDVTLNPQGNATELVFDSLRFDEYGQLAEITPDALTVPIGLTGHVMTRGSILVGGISDESTMLPPPSISFNPLDTYVLAWRPTVGNPTALQWVKLPDAVAPSNAKVVEVKAGIGIYVSNDPEYPEISFQTTTIPDYPANLPVQTGAQLVMYDPVTNTDYMIDASRVSGANAPTGFLRAVKDDPNPELGGNLFVGSRYITGNQFNGITLQVPDTGRVAISNIDNITNPSSPTTTFQYFPGTPPTFTTTEIDQGLANAFMKIGPGGIMYWDKTPMPQTGITELNAGVGIAMTPVGQITSTGSIRVDLTDLPIQTADIFSDYVMLQDANRTVYRNTLNNLTLTLPKSIAVDPVYGSDTVHPSRGQLSHPWRTINRAIQSVPDSEEIKSIILFPGTYVEDIVVDRQSVQIVGMLGPDQTIIQGTITYDSYVNPFTIPDNALRGVTFDISNLLVEPDRILTAVNGIGRLFIDDCRFYRPGNDYKRLKEIIRFAGTQLGAVVLNNCRYHGIIYNDFQFDVTNEYDDGNVIISNTVGSETYMLSVVTGPLSLTKVVNANYMCQARHFGGTLELANIGMMQGDFSDAVWDAITDPDTQDPEDMGSIREGVWSTAPNNARNLLIMTNVSMGFTGSYYKYKASSITKTGTCQYSFNNVDRLPRLDTITGTRYRYGGGPGVDVPETVATETQVSGTFDAFISVSRTWDLTLTGNTTINLVEDFLTTDLYIPGAYANSVSVLVRQGASNFSVNFSAAGGIIWPDGAGQPGMASGQGNVSLFTFLRVGNTWMGSRTFNQV